MSELKPIVEMVKVCKYFGAIRALENVNLKLFHQEILGLVGDNAAGKSTLLKILAGVYTPDKGELFIEGKRVHIQNPMDSRRLGIETVYQDFMLAPNLDIVANIFLGREITKWGKLSKLNKKEMEKRAVDVLKNELNIDLGSLNTLVMSLSGGQQQIVAIARALLYKPKVILMDEPTASLSVRAIEPFLELVKGLREKGIIVLRAGRLVAERKRKDTNLEEIVNFMLGIENKNDRKV